ncbi:MAG: AAA family ATPase [Myxococcota bacterium]
MRIARIRGRNLASLAGDFEVDLEGGPLGEASLFAITGPTGAGKSTILDAVCLALFDKTPRLGDGGRDVAAIGRAGDDEAMRIKANDVRSLLSRGAGEGYAEVEFIGGDGRRYAARWDVRRARDRASGKLQAQSMTLTDVEAQTKLGGTKTETLAAIAERVGLSFEQFRRAVLLAQGDFAAFLEAGGNERAELLERMTDSGIYARLSQAAYERHKACAARIAEIEAERARVGLMDGERRAEVEALREGARVALAEAKAEAEAASAAVGWYGELARRAAGVEAARVELAAAEAAWEAAEQRRARLAEARAAEPMRGARDGAAKATEAEARAGEKRDRAAAEAVVARGVAEAAAGALKLAEAELAAAREAWAAAEPELLAARELDSRVKQAEAGATKLAADVEAARARVEAAGALLAGLLAEQAAQAAARDAARAWLEAHGPAVALAGRWEEIEGDIAAYLEVHGQLVAQRAEAAARAEAAGAAAAKHAGLDARVKEAEGALRAAEAALGAAEAAAAQAAGGALQEQGRRLRALGEAARGCREAAEAAAREATARAEAQARAEAEAQAQAAAGAVEAESAEAAGRLEAERAEAGRALDAARSAQTLEQKRAELRAGEPCPLCGAEEHPWADGSPLAGLVSQYTLRCTELEGALKMARERAVAAKADRAGAEARAGGARAREAEAAQALEGLARRGAGLREGLREAHAGWVAAGAGARGEAVAGAVAATLAAQVTEAAAATEGLAAEVAQAERALAAEQQRADAAAAAAAAARGGVDAARAAWDGAQAQAQAAAAEAGEAHGLAQAAAAEVRRFEASAAEMAARIERTAQGRPGLATRVVADAEVVLAALRAEVTEALDQQERAKEAEAALAGLGTDVAAARASVEAAQARAGELAGEVQAAQAGLHGLRGERAALLGGRETLDVETGLKSALATGEKKAQDAAGAANRAANASAAADSAAKALVAEAETRAEEARTAREVLDDALREAGIDAEELARRLSHAPGWLAEEGRALEALAQARTKAHTVLEERQRQQLEHEATARPELAEDSAREALAAAQAATDANQRTVQAQELLLMQDDQRRVQSAELDKSAEEAREGGRVWAQLNQLIGSAQGDVFRRFAQGLTLDALLVHANRQLDDLNRRYHIERVPGSDMDLQVIDREMGDEVRTIRSLSGGETFLVSLALALGLASLSAAGASVESLFIDEGFGTLDRDTLDIAINALDALHATGRKVGIISHVDGLAEHLGAELRVVKLGGGRSRIEAHGRERAAVATTASPRTGSALLT